jgi:hypothetical protein
MIVGLIGLAIFLVSLLVTTGITVLILVKLPADHFARQVSKRSGSRWTHWLRFVGRNLLALMVVALGVVLSLPGIPGQGILTILLGLMLADFPGKQKLERRIIGVPRVLQAINRLRERFGKAPLII